jgi:NAD(P)H-dependent flavin oxidoreductase YrpB (nitropropane dioxygenase family)
MTTAVTGRPLPIVIQGGMGVAVSSWPLARAVSRRGQLGVVSGTALDLVLARRLQDGDPGGHARRALAAFPVPDVSERVLARWLRPDGRGDRPYRPVPRVSLRPGREAVELAVVAAFAEVWLAKEGHGGEVGVNLMDKIRMALPPTLYGALLAGVDQVIVGAGVPRDVPALLRRLTRHEPVAVAVDVAGGDPYDLTFDPRPFAAGPSPALRLPRFLAVVSSPVLGAYLCREDGTRPDGFVVEGPSAGGHNAPPRGRLRLDATGQPVYGPRDHADLERFAALGLPFWAAGGYGHPGRLAEARAAGASGVQVGTLFAMCRESGMAGSLRRDVLRRLRDGTLEVRTEPAASPTGFPFKVARLPGSVADPEVHDARPRLCDLGYLRTPYAREAGGIGYRCPAEPVAHHARKGGDAAGAAAAVCLCNGLTAAVGLGQTRADGYAEPPLVTLGADLDAVRELLRVRDAGGEPDAEWTAEQVLDWILGEAPAG